MTGRGVLEIRIDIRNTKVPELFNTAVLLILLSVLLGFPAEIKIDVNIISYFV